MSVKVQFFLKKCQKLLFFCQSGEISPNLVVLSLFSKDLLKAGVYMVSGPVVGGIVNKYGIRVSCIAGSVLSCIGFALSTLSPNVPVLMLTYGVIGGFGLGEINGVIMGVVV